MMEQSADNFSSMLHSPAKILLELSENPPPAPPPLPMPLRPLRKTYNCTYCSLKFYNYQSLGGHQKVHRKKRTATARRAGARRVSVRQVAASATYSSIGSASAGTFLALIADYTGASRGVDDRVDPEIDLSLHL